MYRALESFTTKTYDVKRKQILQDDFTTQDEINEFLRIGYIEVYDSSLEVTENGIYNVEDYETADVNVPSDPPNLQDKSITVTTNTTTKVSADSQYDGLNEVSVTTNVQPNLQSKSITITENRDTTVSADEGYDGLSEVNITTNVSGDIEINDASYLFYGGARLNTMNELLAICKNVTNMGDMFYNCSNLSSINVSNLNTSEVTNMALAFYNCSNLTNLDVSNWNTSKLNNMLQIFYGCRRLVNLDLSNWDISKVKDMRSAFNDCGSLSNESLNSILKILPNASISSSEKKLSRIGLNGTQANTCTTLSNWPLAEAAGWITGY